MRAFTLANSGRFTSGNNLKYEDYLVAKYKSAGAGLMAYYPLGEAAAASSVTDLGPNNYSSNTSTAGVTFGNASNISNTAKTAPTLVAASGTGNSYIQLDSTAGTRFQTDKFTISCWFKRTGAGIIIGGSSAGTGSGGVFLEPLVCKGVAEAEGANLNANFALGLEFLNATTLYLSADFEKGSTADNATRPLGRNARMLDVLPDQTTDTFQVKEHTTIASAPVVNHGFANGDRVRFGGTLPTGSSPAMVTASAAASAAGTCWLYVVNATATTFQVSTTFEGPPTTFTGNGSATWCNHVKAPATISTSDTNWHFAVTTWDGTRLKTYLDGTLSENEVPTMYPPENTSVQVCCVGCGMASITGLSTRTGAFLGSISHVAMWNVALNSSQILDLYNKGVETPIAVAIPPAAALSSAASVYAGNASTFIVQLTDPVVAIDDSSVLGASVVLKKDGATLVQATDYSFAYNSGTDQITLTATGIGATFPAGSYQVLLN